MIPFDPGPEYIKLREIWFTILGDINRESRTFHIGPIDPIFLLLEEIK
jgi:hypothetical protein